MFDKWSIILVLGLCAIPVVLMCIQGCSRQSPAAPEVSSTAKAPDVPALWEVEKAARERDLGASEKRRKYVKWSIDNELKKNYINGRAEFLFVAIGQRDETIDAYIEEYRQAGWQVTCDVKNEKLPYHLTVVFEKPDGGECDNP
jgi:hypothetical protein